MCGLLPPKLTPPHGWCLRCGNTCPIKTPRHSVNVSAGWVAPTVVFPPPVETLGQLPRVEKGLLHSSGLRAVKYCGELAGTLAWRSATCCAFVGAWDRTSALGERWRVMLSLRPVLAPPSCLVAAGTMTLGGWVDMGGCDVNAETGWLPLSKSCPRVVRAPIATIPLHVPCRG